MPASGTATKKAGAAKPTAKPAAVPKASKTLGSTAKNVTAGQVHTIKVGETATATVEGHAARVDSPEFVASRTALHKILNQTGAFFYGAGQIQAHHGGSIWVYDGKTWRMYQNLAGIEWSGQFCADPAKVDLLRQNAKALVDHFPQTIPKLKELGYLDAERVLNTPITDAEGIAHFVDSLYNACVPLPQQVHTGAITSTSDRSAGKHTYPTPNDDTVFFCRSDFHPFVYDKATKTTVNVVPVAPRGSGDGRLRVIGVHSDDVAHPGAKKLAKKHANAHKSGTATILQPDDPIAKQAFRDQQ
jgi:hypothetical protein